MRPIPALLLYSFGNGSLIKEKGSKKTYQNPVDFAYLLCQAFIINGSEAYTVQYLDTPKQKSSFISFWMQFSDF